LEVGLLVGTFPQELSSLQLTGEPVVVQRKNPWAPDRSTRGNKKKRVLPHRPTVDWELEASTVANRALRLMLILGAAVAQKDHCHLVDTSGCPEPGEAETERHTM